MYFRSSLIKIQGVEDKESADFYLGKRVYFIYKASTARKGKNGETKYRTVAGKVCRTHGNNGVVRAQFKNNLPPKAMGASVRVMLYPSRV